MKSSEKKAIFLIFDVTLIKVKFMPVKKFSHAYRRQLPNIIRTGLITREIFKGDDNAAAVAAG